MKKNIVFFNGFFLPHLGGVERYTNNLAKYLKKKYNIFIVTTNVPNSIEKEVIDGVTVYRLPVYNIFANRYPILKKNKVYFRIINEIKKMEISHIICNTRYYQTSILGAKLARQMNVDLSIIDHSSSHVSIGNKILDFFGSIYENHITRKILKSSPRFYGVSKRCNEWLKYYNIDASGVFYNSIDKIESPDKKIEDIIHIGYVGRVIPEKGIENLIKAYYVLKEKYNIDLTVVGDGPQLKYLKNTYPEVTYTGAVNHDSVIENMKKFDIFVHPSMYPEGLPTSILEAGMMKCAVVATDRGGTTEVISNSNLGIIVKENVQDLIDKLDSLLSDKKKILNFQNSIYNEICKKFTWEKTAMFVEEELKKYEKNC